MTNFLLKLNHLNKKPKQIKTIYNSQLIQNKKTNITYLMMNEWRNVQMMNGVRPDPNFYKQRRAPLFLNVGILVHVRPCPTSSQGRARTCAHMEALVCPSLVEQLCSRAAITTRTSLRVRVTDGLITTFEAINFVHLSRTC